MDMLQGTTSCELAGPRARDRDGQRRRHRGRAKLAEASATRRARRTCPRAYGSAWRPGLTITVMYATCQRDTDRHGARSSDCPTALLSLPPFVPTTRHCTWDIGGPMPGAMSMSMPCHAMGHPRRAPTWAKLTAPPLPESTGRMQLLPGPRLHVRTTASGRDGTPLTTQPPRRPPSPTAHPRSTMTVGYVRRGWPDEEGRADSNYNNNRGKTGAARQGPETFGPVERREGMADIDARKQASRQAKQGANGQQARIRAGRQALAHGTPHVYTQDAHAARTPTCSRARPHTPGQTVTRRGGRGASLAVPLRARAHLAWAALRFAAGATRVTEGDRQYRRG
ncbi:hypothetical protein Purlil1_10049 [Purpureocillium lilacinum]|uniref:Uncharacterized protein n=1 Tax=Purpureocillium lilacinum TaxID=33203 RepID=A0ABR0BNF9_PURLI|nr:hypothetical protein Purlil1_10049 [Purpureocillium lilacinum]